MLFGSQQLLCHFTEFFIPRFAKATCQRAFEETIDRKLQLVSFLHRIFTHRPAVIVQSYEPTGESFLANGIECTTDGFTEFRLTIAIGTFQCTEATSVVVTSKHAVFSAHNTRHQVAIGIAVSHPLTVDYGLCRCRKVFPNGIETVLNSHHFIGTDRCTGITFHATDTLTGIEVSTKTLCQYVRRHQYAVNIYNRWYLHHLSIFGFTIR